MSNEKRYKCKKCEFEWFSRGKTFLKCPVCQSNDICLAVQEKNSQYSEPSVIKMNGERRGMRAGAPRVCKCQKCGHESPKIPGVPCRNDKCPECGFPLCGAD